MRDCASCVISISCFRMFNSWIIDPTISKANRVPSSHALSSGDSDSICHRLTPQKVSKSNLKIADNVKKSAPFLANVGFPCFTLAKFLVRVHCGLLQRGGNDFMTFMAICEAVYGLCSRGQPGPLQPWAVCVSRVKSGLHRKNPSAIPFHLILRSGIPLEAATPMRHTAHTFVVPGQDIGARQRGQTAGPTRDERR